MNLHDTVMVWLVIVITLVVFGNFSFSEFNNDMTHQFSNIITNTQHKPILENLIESITTTINENSPILSEQMQNDFYQLIEYSIFISQLVQMSVTIPSETIITNTNALNQFETFSKRIKHNNGTFNETINDISISIGSKDTNIGRDDFALYKTSLNSVDIIAFVFNKQQRLSLTILSNQSGSVDENENYKLQENVTLIFPKNKYSNYSKDNSSNSSFIPECLWYNISASIWQCDGCVTRITPKNDISCKCNHLTTFIVLWHIEEEEESELLNEYTSNPAFFFILLSLMAGYIGAAAVLCFLVYKLIKYKMKIVLCKKDKTYETAYGALCLTLIQCLLQINFCFMFYIFGAHLNTSANFADSNEIIEISIEYLTVSSLLPLIISFYIFSHIIYGTFIISASVSARANKKKRRIGRIVMIANVFITIFFIFIIILLVFDLNETIIVAASGFINSRHLFVFFSIAFCLLLLASAILILVCAIRALEVVKMLVADEMKDQQKKAIFRIKIGSFGSAFLVIAEIVMTIYFTAFPRSLTPIFQMSDIFIDLVFCCITIYVYHHYAQAKINEKIRLGTYVYSYRF